MLTPLRSKIGDLVAHRARRRPDHDVVRFEAERLSYGRLDEDANRLAASLASLGLARPATCAVQLPNCVEFVITWIALARLGVIEVPVSTSLRGDLLAHQLRTANCELVVTTVGWAPRFDEVAAASGDPDRLFRSAVFWAAISFIALL